MLVLFAASNTLLEPLRLHDPREVVYWGPFPQLLWTNAGMTAAFFLLLLVLEQRMRAAPTARVASPFLTRSTMSAGGGG
jgi:hypothetical protein